MSWRLSRVLALGLTAGLLGVAVLGSGCRGVQSDRAGSGGGSVGTSSGYELRRFVVQAGPWNYDENVYLLVHTASKQGLIIDPGARSDALEAYVRDEGVRISGVLNTHAHYDHIGANAHYRDLYLVDVYASPADADLYRAQDVPVDPENAPTGEIPTRGEFRVGELTVRVLPTPGHTAGSVCFLIGDMLLSGDTLFRGSVGRTKDAASANLLVTSIRDELLVLPPDTVVHSGHGDSTTIGYEKQYNAFLQDR